MKSYVKRKSLSNVIRSNCKKKCDNFKKKLQNSQFLPKKYIKTDYN